ncbi:MAG: HYR domain-containing protein, partial [Limisphaerales bacterium]
CSPPSGSLFPVGTTVVTCTATDAVGNQASCQFTVTVNDVQGPTIVCSPNIVTGTDPGRCDAAVTYTVTASNGCPGVTLICNPPSGSIFPKGTTTVNCTATDVAGNTASCSFTVTVNDDENPTVACPANITTNTAPGRCDATVSYTASAADNCPGVSLVCTPPSGSVFPKGVTTVTCTATDASGNSASCQFTVTVNDNEKPTVSCPANITVNNDPGQCGAIVSYTVSATDNCAGENFFLNCNPPPNSLFPVGINTVKCVATDGSGNKDSCSFTVTVNDTQKPTVTCPLNIITNTSPGRCDATVSYNATHGDNCPGETMVCTPPPGSVFPKGTTPVKCVVTDASGNKDSCQFTITVNDNEKPSVVCPANITTTAAAGRCDAAVSYTATPNDNCPGVSLVCTPPSGSVFSAGTTPVKCVATDAAGNKDSCQFTVTVNDGQKPIVNCPANINVNNSPGRCDATVSYTATASDNCPGTVLVCTPPSGSSFAVGITTVKCVATDAAGNKDSCQFTVTVRDNEPPSVQCPPGLTIQRTPGVCLTPGIFQVPATDNCSGPVTVVCNPPSGSTFPSGTTTVNCMATDANGNSANCSFTVTVLEPGSPAIACADTVVSASVGETVQIHVQVTSGNPAFIVQLVPGSATHNGLPATPTNPPSIQNNRDFVWAVNGDTGRWCFKVKVTDGCGDFDSCLVCIDVFLETCLQLQIAKIENAYQGQDWEVSIDNPLQFADPGVQPNPSGIGGFSFLISYDCACLQFLSARKGQMLVDQGWEFFTYRYGAIGNGNCGTGCPSCLIRVVAIADVNNGSAHPNMSRNNMGQWVVLKFRVTNDRTFAGQFCQVNWFWFDCTDNTVSDSTGNQLWVAESLFTFEGTPINLATEFPANVANCDRFSGGPGKPSPRKKLCFRNGGIDIPTGEEIDDRGDLNLNGMPYDVGDAVLYENYFVYGPSVLSSNPTQRQAQLAASDVNGDGLILSVGDLVALIRVITHDAEPLPKLNPNAATVQLRWKQEGNELKITTSSSSELGGVFLNFQYAGSSVGEITALTDVQGMKFRANTEEGTLRVLVSSEAKNGMVPPGEASFVVPVDGAVEFVEAQASNYQGQNLPVVTKAAALPTAFGISQNYPNPFNAKTNLELALPVASDYRLTIYNISGQVVKTFSGSAPAGTKIIIWDGADKNGAAVSSGIYFYKAEAGGFQAVKKMLLIK